MSIHKLNLSKFDGIIYIITYFLKYQAKKKHFRFFVVVTERSKYSVILKNIFQVFELDPWRVEVPDVTISSLTKKLSMYVLFVFLSDARGLLH